MIVRTRPRCNAKETQYSGNFEISLRSIILSARKAQRLRSADTLIPFLHSDSQKLTWILESFEFCLQIVNLLKRPAFVYFLIAQILRISCHSFRWTMRWSGSSVLSTTNYILFATDKTCTILTPEPSKNQVALFVF